MSESKVMRIPLAPELVTILERAMRPGICFIGKLTRETFTGDNHRTSGMLYLELGPVPESALPELREVVAKARAKVGK